MIRSFTGRDRFWRQEALRMPFHGIIEYILGTWMNCKMHGRSCFMQWHHRRGDGGGGLSDAIANERKAKKIRRSAPAITLAGAEDVAPDTYVLAGKCLITIRERNVLWRAETSCFSCIAMVSSGGISGGCAAAIPAPAGDASIITATPERSASVALTSGLPESIGPPSGGGLRAGARRVSG